MVIVPYLSYIMRSCLGGGGGSFLCFCVLFILHVCSCLMLVCLWFMYYRSYVMRSCLGGRRYFLCFCDLFILHSRAPSPFTSPKANTYRRRKVLCIERGVQCCTLRSKLQDKGLVYRACKTTSATGGRRRAAGSAARPHPQ